MAVNDPYDWDDYRSDFVPSEAYRLQEAALVNLLTASFPSSPPASVLEVGPGFGRVTKILVGLWPMSKFALTDLSEAAITQASEACPQIDFSMAVGCLQDARPFPRQTFDLVVAVEVLLHIPPTDNQIQRAINNLLSCLKPARAPTRAHGTSSSLVVAARPQPGGVLITCDWTQSLGPQVPIRRDNNCHDYAALFSASRPKSTVVAAVSTGLQTIFVVQRAAQATQATRG